MNIKNILNEKFECDDYENSYLLNEYRYEILKHLNEKLLRLKYYIGKFIKEKQESKTLSKSIEINEKENFYNIYILLEKTLDTLLNENINMIIKILEYINSLKEFFNLYFNKYKDFLILKNKFAAKLNEVIYNKNNFIESAKNAELCIYNFLKKKVSNIKFNSDMEFNNKEELKNIAKNELEKYKNKINEGNEILKLFNMNQNELYKTEKELEVKYNEIYSDCLMTYLEHQLLLNDLEKETKETILNLNKKSNKQKLNDYLKLYRQKNEIEFEQYKTQIDIDNCADNLELTTCFSVFEELGQYIGKYKPGELFEETKKLEMSKEINRILYLDEKITDEDVEKLFKITKNTIGQTRFINNLSILRSNGIYKKSEIFINSMGKILNKILISAEKENDFILVKNIIILSQTYYYFDLNNEKQYIFQSIKDNKWLKTSKFWREFIEANITREFERAFSYKNRNLNDILLTQLLPYINNMMDFEIDIRLIVKIMDEFVEKYNYLNEESYQILFSMINSDLEEIEKIRKEFRDNPNLKEELIQKEENLNNNIKENEKIYDKNIKNNINENIENDDSKKEGDNIKNKIKNSGQKKES